MSIKGVSIQLMIGEREEASFSIKEIESCIRKAASMTGIRRLLFWNAGVKKNHDLISSISSDLGIELYTWFPVLADIVDGHVSLDESQLNPAGIRGYGKSGKWSKIDKGEENFLFACPEQSHKIASINRSLENILDSYDYSGVFLDRIRYPSFAGGLESVFGCICQDCMRSYEAYSGDTSDELNMKLEEILNFLALADEKNLEGIHSYEDLFALSGAETFYKFRSLQIERIVSHFSSTAKSRGMKVGLDLLTPSMSDITGQNYGKLHQFSDWIKMMTYCYANGPAGIPLEAVSLIRGLKAISRKSLPEKAYINLCSRLFKTELASSCDIILKNGIHPNYISSELEFAAALMPGFEDKLIPGIELVNHPFFTPPVRKDQCEASLNILKDLEHEIIASWNILYIPDEYFSMIKERMI